MTRLSDYSDLSSAIASMVGPGDLLVDRAENISSTITVPRTVTLVGGGGVLIVLTGGSLTIRGLIRSSVMLLGAATVAIAGQSVPIMIKSGQDVDPRWFGVLDIGESDDEPEENADSLREAWNACAALSELQLGGHLRINAGTFVCSRGIDTNDQFTADGRLMTVRGHGSRLSVFKIAGSAGFNLDDMHNGQIADVGFDGNKTVNQWPAGTAVLRASTYNLRISNVHIKNSPADGIHLSGSQQYSLSHVESELNNGWGIVVHDTYSSNVHSSSFESNGIGGVLVTANGRHRRTNNKLDSLYLENNPIGLEIRGVENIVASNLYCRGSGSQYAVKLSRDPSQSNRPARFNEIDATNCTKPAKIDAGCHGNQIRFSPDNIEFYSEDLDGRNYYLPASEEWSVDANGYDDTAQSISLETDPTKLATTIQPTSSKLTRNGSVDSPLFDLPHHLEITSVGGDFNAGTQFATTGPVSSDHCFFVLLCVDGIGFGNLHVLIIDTLTNDNYSFVTRTWGQHSPLPYLRFGARSRKATMFRFPVSVSGSRRLRAQVGIDNGYGSILRMYWGNWSTSVVGSRSL